MFEIIAMLTMLIDHIGCVFFPHIDWLRNIGRVAMPLYTYGIVQGYKYTSDYRKYLIRVVSLAVVSEVFHLFLFHDHKLNIIFTFAICLIMLRYYEKSNSKIKYIGLIILASLAQAFCDYGIYAIVLMVIYYNNKLISFKHFVLNVLYGVFLHQLVQMYSIFSSLMIESLGNIRLTGRARTAYRLFYPVHLAVLLLIRNLIY
jgi:hypothetical protein